MLDTEKKYTLTEIAKELNVVPTFINRVQRETQIGPAIGMRGKIASFEKKYVQIFRMVKALRMIGFSFEDIKKLWLHEEAILKIQAKLVDGGISKLPLVIDAPDVQSIKLVLHPDPVYCSSKLDDLRLQDPYKKEYPELLAMLSKCKEEIVERRKNFTEDLKKMGADLDVVLT